MNYETYPSTKCGFVSMEVNVVLVVSVVIKGKSGFISLPIYVRMDYKCPKMASESSYFPISLQISVWKVLFLQ